MSEYRDPDLLVDEALEVTRNHKLLNVPSKWATHQNQIVFPRGEPLEGPLDLDRFPPQRAIMDAIGVQDPCTQVTIMASAQIGKTLCYLLALGQRIDEYPSRFMIVIPKGEKAAKYHTSKWSPFVNASARLRAKLGQPGMVDNVALAEFPGGTIAICGGKIPDTFRETPYEIVVLDDLDAIPPNPEGEHIGLARARTTMYRLKSPKVIAVSSPVEVAGPIDSAWQESSQERWFVPCLRCGHMQTLELDPMLCWTPGQPNTAHFPCQGDGCGHRIRQHEIKAMNARGRYRARYPERMPFHRGLRLSQGCAPLEFASWAVYAEKKEAADKIFEATGNEDARRTVRNTMAGLPYESVSGAKLDELAQATRARAEQPWDLATKPIHIRTIGCDPGGHGIACQEVGHGPARERWILDYQNLPGNVRYDALWDAWCALVIERKPEAVCIDASWEQDLVCQQLLRLSVRLHEAGIYVWAIKGQEGERLLWPGPTEWGNLRDDTGTPYPVSIGVDAAKSAIYDSLKTKSKAGAGVIHFTVDRKKRYFRELFSERRVQPGDKVGKRTLFVRRSSRVRAEALDTLVYAMAAADGYVAITEALGHPGLRAALAGEAAGPAQPTAVLAAATPRASTPAAVSNPWDPSSLF